MVPEHRERERTDRDELTACECGRFHVNMSAKTCTQSDLQKCQGNVRTEQQLVKHMLSERITFQSSGAVRFLFICSQTLQLQIRSSCSVI